MRKPTISNPLVMMASKTGVIMMCAKNIGNLDFKIAPEIIYHTLRRFDCRVGMLEYREDVLQEIRLVLLCFPEDEIVELFRKASSAVQRMLQRYGKKRNQNLCELPFSTLTRNLEESGKEAFLSDFFLTSESRRERLEENERAVLEAVLSFYETHTAQETCKELGVAWTPKIQKLLAVCAPKHTQENRKKSHITLAERQRLEFFFKRGLSVEEAAEKVGRNRGTIFYELKRCGLNRDNYDAQEAHRIAEERVKQK